MHLTAIVAIDGDNLMGLNGALPWHCKADLKHFKAATNGGILIMGRATWDSLPKKPLPGRRCIVVTSAPTLTDAFDDSYAVPTLDDAIELASKFSDRAFVIGGSQLFKSAIFRCEAILLTVIHQATQVEVNDHPIYLNTSAFSLFEKVEEVVVDQEHCTFITLLRREPTCFNTRT